MYFIFDRNESNGPWEDDDSDRAVFLKLFPAQKKEVETCIRHLRQMADNMDKIHKDCTIANLAANSASASSGIMTILGLALAPFTAGGSLFLTAAGLGFGAAAAVTGITAGIYERVSNSKEREKAQELMSKCERSLRMVTCPDETDFSPEFSPGSNKDVEENLKTAASTVASQMPKMYTSLNGIKTNVRAMKTLHTNPGLKVLAKRVAAAGSTTRRAIKGTKQVEKAFAGTAFAMTKGARLAGAATAGVFVIYDAYSLVQDAKHLTEGAKTETAAEIRNNASNLEKKLEDLNELYEALRTQM